MEEIKETRTTQNIVPGGTSINNTNGIPASADVSAKTRTTLVKTNQERLKDLVWFLIGSLEVLLALRVIFLLLAARASGFAAFLYTLTYPFVAPFRGIFPAPAEGGSYLDTAAILAMIIYALIAWGIVALIDILLRPKSV